MIHIAPCSCELHQAVREALARAEKAEARVAELSATVGDETPSQGVQEREAD